MKHIFFILLLAGGCLQAQVALNYNKRFVECEDKWVAFQLHEDSTSAYGFIYIDEDAGLTFNLEGKYKLTPEGKLQAEKTSGSNIKMRLEPNNVKVAVIPESMYTVFQVDTVPEWLQYYQTNLNSVARLYKWGFMYNGWDMCDKALEYLLKAQAIDPNYPDLAVEIAYSYNCLNQYEEALSVLETAIKNNPTDAYINKEYIYSLVNSKKIDKAIEQYLHSVDIDIAKTFNAENCFNILGYYYKQNDAANFKIWKKELKKWPINNPQIKDYLKRMEEDMK